MDIIRISWISTFCGYRPHFMDIVRILWISWIYQHFMDIICIGRITSYLACSFRHIFHIFSSGVSEWCITSFLVCNLIFFPLPLTFSLFVLWVSINWILTLSGYMWLLFSLQSKIVFLFRLIFRFVCCIGMLYKRVVWITCCIPAL